MTIYAISPSFLEALATEAAKFSFQLQAYGDPEKAKIGLRTINVSEIGGFIYLANSLPVDTTQLDNFIKLCDSICRVQKKKFLLALKEVKTLTNLRIENYANLDFRLIQYKDITDTFINRELFGSILIEQVSPYYFDNVDRQDNQRVASSSFERYRPIFDSEVLQLFEQPVLFENVESTLRHDALYQELSKSNMPLSKIRKLQVLSAFNEKCTELYNEINEECNKIIDHKQFCTVKSLLNLYSRLERV